MFLLVYLALWKYRDDEGPLVTASFPPGGRPGPASLHVSLSDLEERVVFCQPEDQVTDHSA